MMGHNYSTDQHHHQHQHNNNISQNKISNLRQIIQNANIVSNSISHNNRVIDLDIKQNPLKDDYLITKNKLGIGLNGTVVTCINKRTNKEYALKTLLDSPKSRHEATLHYKACQNCPYIVQIIDVYENTYGRHKVLFIVMEKMKGGELFDQIIKRSDQHRPFTEKEVAKIMFQICSAVKHLHDMNIAHRDLKPENLLLTSDKNDTLIKLTDFGFAKENNLGLKTPCYTPYYVAPEVFGPTQYDKSCDIWSLGVIMYILCCGYPPFFSEHGEVISPGMKRRIRAGAYTFPEKEWSGVSENAKILIHEMLEIATDKRITIDDIMKNEWIAVNTFQYKNVPENELNACQILKQDQSRISAMENAMENALSEMRIDQKLKLKSLQESDNPLFKKRLERKNKSNVSSNQQQQQQQESKKLIQSNRLDSDGQTSDESTTL